VNRLRKKENLADLDRLPDERQGTWAYPFENWLLGNLAIELARTLERKKPANGQPAGEKTALQRILSQFIENNPRILFLAPHLLRRGDEKARQFVMHLAAASGQPQLVQLLMDFIGGKEGPVPQRMEAAHQLSAAGLLPAGPLPIWAGGEQREILLFNTEVSPEPKDPGYPRAVQDLAEQAYDALQQHNGRRVQELLERAVAMQPDDPSLLNNLADGRDDAAGNWLEMLEQTYPDHPRLPYYRRRVGKPGRNK
jgi:hypothetical protein